MHIDALGLAIGVILTQPGEYSMDYPILLGHTVCKEGIKVDFAKIKIILDLKPLVNPRHVRVLLGHTRYYRKFIRYYSDMKYPLEELLREDQEFNWTK